MAASGRLDLCQARPYDVRYRRFVQLLGDAYDEQRSVDRYRQAVNVAAALLAKPGVSTDKVLSLLQQYQSQWEGAAWPWLQFNTSIADTNRMVDAYTNRFGDLNDPEVRKRHEEAAKWWIENSQTKKNERLKKLMQDKLQVRRQTRRTSKRL